MQNLKFKNISHSGFYATLRSRVDQYFNTEGISKHANALMVFKLVFFLGGALAIYSLILFGGFPPYVMLILAIVLGMNGSFIGFNVCHDAIHGAVSKHQTVNKFFGSVFNLIGANPYMWNIAHNIVHHTYTNIPEHDDDLMVAPGLVRVHPQDKLTWIQRYQHLYAFFLYAFSGLSWVVRKDFYKFFEKKIGNYDNSYHPKREYFKLFFYKALYYFLTLLLPYLILDIPFWQVLIGWVSMQMAKGIVMSVVFQLAHIVEGLEYPEPNEQGFMEDAWADHQLRTTSNFARNNFIVSFFCGGLNMQVEHHLFPKVCHVHYHAISKIVKETAEDYAIPYHEFKSVAGAIASHYRVLKIMGRAELIPQKI